MIHLLPWLLSSSLLILTVIVLRAVFGKRLSPGVRYALWGLVLLRLLIPGTLFAFHFDLPDLFGPGEEQPAVSAEMPADETPYAIAAPPEYSELSPSAVTPAETDGYSALTVPAAQPQQQTPPAAVPARQPLSVPRLLHILWLAGMAVTALLFIGVNLRFWLRLRSRRARMDVDSPLPVYLVDDLSSSCLFSGAIYMAPETAEDASCLCHVLEHELAHHRHGDRLWALLRCAALILHWYNPLVWWAARLSRQDSELFADVGAISRLGEAARESYGSTLIRLAAGPSSRTPLLVPVTAIKSSKKELRERVSLIAHPVRRSLAAAILVLILAVAAAGCAFAGTAEDESSPGETAVAGESSVAPGAYLTGDELAYFNDEFFAQPTMFGPASYINIHNQFLSSLYSSPEEIDLFQLFYCGAGYPDTELSEEELAEVGMPEVCSTDKLPAAEIDAVFYANTGLHLADTQQIGLDRFDYLAQYDAYYHSHGDTNYRGAVTILGGLREDDLVHLYYYDDFMGGGWKCVTLRRAGEEGWHFVSNLETEKPSLPTVYPAGEPWLTVPLADLEPYEPQEVEMTAHENDCAEWGGGFMTDNGIDVRIYTSTDGNTYAAVIDEMAFSGAGYISSWRARSFLTLPKDAREANVFFFRDLFGYDGLIVSYEGEMPPLDGRINGISRLYYYYCFSDVGTPTLLASCVSSEEPLLCDLDGDGENELLSNGPDRADLFFQRDGSLYHADLYELFTAAAAYAGDPWWSDSDMDLSHRCLKVHGYWRPESYDSGHMTAFWRCIYFDGDDLLIYKDPDMTVSDNVADTVEAPAQVIADAKAALAAGYSQEVLDDWADDWCLSSCQLTDRVVRKDYELEIFRINKLFHAPDPSQVMLAGGAYVREDDWVSIDHSQYLVYQVKDGQRRLLEGSIAFDIAGWDRAGEVAYIELDNGLRTPAELTGEELLWLFRCRGPWQTLDLLGSFGEGECRPALELLVGTLQNQGIADELTQAMTQTYPGGESGLTPEGRAAYDYLTYLINVKS